MKRRPMKPFCSILPLPLVSLELKYRPSCLNCVDTIILSHDFCIDQVQKRMYECLLGFKKRMFIRVLETPPISIFAPWLFLILRNNFTALIFPAFVGDNPLIGYVVEAAIMAELDRHPPIATLISISPLPRKAKAAWYTALPLPWYFSL